MEVGESYILKEDYYGVPKGTEVTLSRKVEFRWSNSYFWRAWYKGSDILQSPEYIHIYDDDLNKIEKL